MIMISKRNFCDNDKKDTSFHPADKQRKTSEPTNKENILKDDQTGSAKGKRPGTAFGIRCVCILVSACLCAQCFMLHMYKVLHHSRYHNTRYS